MGKESKSSRTKNTLLNLASGFGGQLLTIFFKFVVRTVFINTLGKQYLGINGYFADIINMLSLTELGFGTAISYKLYKPLANHDDKRVRVLLKFYKTAYRVVGFVILALGILLIPALRLLIKDYDSLIEIGINARLIFVLYLLRSAFSYLFFAYRVTVMEANQKKYILNVADYVVTIISNVTQIIIIIVFKDFIIYTVSTVIFTLITNIVNAIIAEKYYPQFFSKEEDSIDKNEVKELFKDCGALFIYKVNGSVLKATDNVVLGAFAGISLVGLYSNYLLFYTTIKSFLRQIYVAVKASMGNLFATEDIKTQYQFFETMNFLTIVLYGTAAVGMAVCTDELIVTWIGKEYVVVQPLSTLVGIEILTNGLKQNLGEIRNVTGVFRQAWRRPILSIIINIVASIFLVQYIGIYGVIIGTILADLLTNLAIDPKIIHKHSFNSYMPVSTYYKKNTIYIIVLITVCLFDYWFCSWFITGFGWVSVFSHVFVVMLTVPSVYIGVFWQSHECIYLRKISFRIISKLAVNRK